MFNKTLKTLACLVAGACMFNSCIGSFGLFNTVLDWNKSATNNKFLNALIFILISPAYALCGVADVFIINTIEFWSGSNPVMADVGKTKNVTGSDGKLYAITTLEDGYEVKGPDGKTVRFVHDEKTDAWAMVQDGKTTPLLKFKDKKNVEIYLKDGKTTEVALNEQGLFDARMAVNEGTYFAFR